jgi:alpha-aminoadipate/glutamate carrier protein LysW
LRPFVSSNDCEERLMAAECPVCDAEVELGDDTVEGELVECPDCGSELEVTSLKPLALAEAPEAEEDWGE